MTFYWYYKNSTRIPKNVNNCLWFTLIIIKSFHGISFDGFNLSEIAISSLSPLLIRLTTTWPRFSFSEHLHNSHFFNSYREANRGWIESMWITCERRRSTMESFCLFACFSSFFSHVPCVSLENVDPCWREKVHEEKKNCLLSLLLYKEHEEKNRFDEKLYGTEKAAQHQ